MARPIEWFSPNTITENLGGCCGANPARLRRWRALPADPGRRGKPRKRRRQRLPLLRWIAELVHPRPTRKRRWVKEFMFRRPQCDVLRHRGVAPLRLVEPWAKFEPTLPAVKIGRTGARGTTERFVLSCGQPGLRGAELLQRRPVPRLRNGTDRCVSREGFRLTNYCPESQCTPTRSALLTGRHAVRSGTHSVPIGQSGGWGLVAWEKTLGDVLSEAGYACAAYGKWHVGEGPGRLG